MAFRLLRAFAQGDNLTEYCHMAEALIDIFESSEARYVAAGVLWLLGVVAIVARKLVA